MTGYDRQTIKDFKSVADKTSSLRNDDLSYGHHREVAPLEPEDQEHFLQKPTNKPIAFEFTDNNGECHQMAKRITLLDGVNDYLMLSCDNPAYKSFWLPLAGITRMFTIDDIIEPGDKAAFMSRVRPD